MPGIPEFGQAAQTPVQPFMGQVSQAQPQYPVANTSPPQASSGGLVNVAGQIRGAVMDQQNMENQGEQMRQAKIDFEEKQARSKAAGNVQTPEEAANWRDAHPGKAYDVNTGGEYDPNKAPDGHADFMANMWHGLGAVGSFVRNHLPGHASTPPTGAIPAPGPAAGPPPDSIAAPTGAPPAAPGIAPGVPGVPGYADGGAVQPSSGWDLAKQAVKEVGNALFSSGAGNQAAQKEKAAVEDAGHQADQIESKMKGGVVGQPDNSAIPAPGPTRVDGSPGSLPFMQGPSAERPVQILAFEQGGAVPAYGVVAGGVRGVRGFDGSGPSVVSQADAPLPAGGDAQPSPAQAHANMVQAVQDFHEHLHNKTLNEQDVPNDKQGIPGGLSYALDKIEAQSPSLAARQRWNAEGHADMPVAGSPGPAGVKPAGAVPAPPAAAAPPAAPAANNGSDAAANERWNASISGVDKSGNPVADPGTGDQTFPNGPRGKVSTPSLQTASAAPAGAAAQAGPQEGASAAPGAPGSGSSDPKVAAADAAVQNASDSTQAQSGDPGSDHKHSITPADWEQSERTKEYAIKMAAYAGADPGQVRNALDANRNAWIQGGVLKYLATANAALMKEPPDTDAVQKAMHNAYYYLPDGNELTFKKTGGQLMYQDPIHPFIDPQHPGVPMAKALGGVANMIPVDAAHIQQMGMAMLDPMNVQNTINNVRIAQSKMELQAKQGEAAMLVGQGRFNQGVGAAKQGEAKLQRVNAENFRDLATGDAERYRAVAVMNHINRIGMGMKADPALLKGAAESATALQNLVQGQKVTDTNGDPMTNPNYGHSMRDSSKVPPELKNASPGDVADASAMAGKIHMGSGGSIPPDEAARLAAVWLQARHIESGAGKDGKKAGVMTNPTTGDTHVWNMKTKQWETFRLPVTGNGLPTAGISSADLDPATLAELSRNSAGGGRGGIEGPGGNSESNPDEEDVLKTDKSEG